MRNNSMRRAYSLVEVLVAIAILGVIVGLTLSAVQRVRVAATRTQCLNNLRQLTIALHSYNDKHGSLPSGFTYEPNKPSLRALGWHARLLPYIERDALWQEILAAYAADPDNTGAGSLAHEKIRAIPVPLFFCPLDGRGPVVTPKGYTIPIGMTTYLGVSGVDTLKKDGCLFINSSVRLTDIKDGTGNTLLVGERPPSTDSIWGWWYRGIGQDLDGGAEVVLGVQELNYSTMTTACPNGPYSYGPGQFTNQCDLFHFWSPHPGGAHFAFADGSARFMKFAAAPIMPALATRAGGESVNVPE